MGKNEKVIALMKHDLGKQIMKKFAWSRAKTDSYLKDKDEDKKKQKRQKKYVTKRKLKFRDYKKCLKASQIESTINYLEQKEINVDSLKEIIKYKRVLLKTQERFKTERHNVFTEETNKIALSSKMTKECNQLICQTHINMEWAKMLYARKKKLNVTV